MTEKSLLLKCDFAGHYFIVGTDFPSARVFDTTTSSLTAVVELPLRSRNVSLAALTLTSVAIHCVDECALDGNTQNQLGGSGGGAATSAAGRKAKARHSTEQLVDDAVSMYYAAVGLSNGTLLLHDVRRDALLAHVQVSETQQPLISLQLCGGFAFCLAGNNMLYVVSLRDPGAGPCLRLRVQPDASSLAVTKTQHKAAEQNSSVDDAHQVYRVMIAGPTNALYEVRTLAHGTGSANAPDTPHVHATKLMAFPSQGTAAEFAWVSAVTLGTAEKGGAVSLPAVTASAQDGVVRLWDLTYDNAGTASASMPLLTAHSDSTVLARCRRTLLCGQRILNVSVLPSDVEGGAGRSGGMRKDNYIMVTTLTGSVLLWSLGDALLPPVVEPMPLKPDVVLVSSAVSGRLLFGALRAAQRGTTDASPSSASALYGLDVTLLRGRFAMPIFETKNIGAAVEGSNATVCGTTDAAAANAARRTALSTLALGVAGNTAITVAELPLSMSSETTLVERQDVDYLLEHTTDAATSAFVVMDTVWAAHQQQVAAKASQSMTEAFKAPQLFHAKSIQDLPVKQLTLEQRLQQVARDEAAAARRRKNISAVDAEDAEAANGRSVLSHHALGLATIPLYQALHANDTSAVMDLLNMSSRSAEGMRATVLSLQLPYCLQLLQVISERLGLCSKAVEKATPNTRVEGAGATGATVMGEQAATQGNRTAAPTPGANEASTAGAADGDAAKTHAEGVLRGGVAAFSIRSSLLEWIDAILNFRGSELLAVQREANARAARKAAGTSTSEDDVAEAVSPPKDFLAPILHHYQELCAQYDKLAVLYGRLSIFKSVRPSQKNEFTNIPRQSLGSNVEMARPGRLGADGHLASSGQSAQKRRLHLSEKSSVVDSDIIFPVMFKESRARSGHRVVRVRSKLEIAKKRQEKENKDMALQKRARALARQELRQRAAKGGHSILDGDDDEGKKVGGLDVMDQIMMAEMKNGADGELDLDALEAMDLADGSEMDGSDADSFDEEEEEEEAEDGDEEGGVPAHPARRGKKARRETVDAMLADVEEGEEDNDKEDDADAGLDSSEAEFSSASDDEVRSDVIDDGSAEEEEEEEGEESESESAESKEDAGSQYSGDDNDDVDGDDGMGEDMQELLARHEDDQDRTERRKAKKVRTD